MKKYMIASVLSLVLGASFSGQAFAEGGTRASDTTPPVIQSAVTGTQGSNGWYTSNVSVAWIVTDPESNITSKSGCGTVSLTTDTSGKTYTCKATSAGGTTTKSVTVKRDVTRPTTTITTPAASATYAFNQVVNASYTCTDAMSKVASCTGTVANGQPINTASAGAKSFAVTAKDNAGNSVTKTVNYTVAGAAAGDTTPPVVTPVLTGTLGANGWYTSNVGLSWTVTDSESAISSISGCSAATVSADTTGTIFTCNATSAGGTTTKSVTVKRDTTPPSVSLVTPAGATYPQGQTITTNYSCTDTTSGVTGCTGTVANNTAINLSTAGTKSFSVNATDQAGNTANKSISYTVGAPIIVSANGTHLFAWNDLGMHCADSDFSTFTLLPPFNNLNAQLVVNGKLVNTLSNYALTYEATSDPTGSINSTSQYKTNFWDYTQPLFGANLNPNIGLTGNPMASLQPAPLAWNNNYKWFEATGIPITPFDDNQRLNYFPLVKVNAIDSSGKTIASSNAVLPISSEINCYTCHASNTGSTAAKPVAGWVNLAAGSEVDWRMNILRLHDEKNKGNVNYAGLLTKKGYGSSLESSPGNGKPVLCDTCHNSNALAVWGINGETGVSNMTAAMHNRHANTKLPGSTLALDSIGTRDACYNCHPGRDTECLRGAMGNPVDLAGKHTMECQSCHGTMATVGSKARIGWFDVPTCQSCHHDGIRETVAINANGTFKTWTDTRFASNANTPATGTSLFRFSTGHSSMQCEACHNSTHAEFTNKPSANGNQVNDNLSAIKAQGYAAAIRECTVCHTTMPTTVNGGPHGMHTIGQSWVSSHHNDSTFSTEPKTTCYVCHGSTSSGSPLAVVKVAKTLNGKTFVADERVTCWSCHNGPNP